MDNGGNRIRVASLLAGIAFVILAAGLGPQIMDWPTSRSLKESGQAAAITSAEGTQKGAAAVYRAKPSASPSATEPGKGALLPTLITSAMPDVPERGGASLESSDILIKRLRDRTASLAERRVAAWQLARHDDPEALAALEETLADGLPDIKATIAEALGYFGHPEALRLLSQTLAGDDPVAARGALRGLPGVEDPEALDLLSAVLSEASRPLSLRSEAALALGEVKSSVSRELLVDTLLTIGPEDVEVLEAILEALGTWPFEEVEGLFVGILDRSQTPTGIRVAALEGLSGSSSGATPILMRALEYDPDPEIRSTAALALADLADPDDVISDLLALLEREHVVEVRQNIYEAIAAQERVDVSHLISAALKESNMEARIAGFDTAAFLLEGSGSKQARRDFDERVVPELLEVALYSPRADRRLDAVMALGIAGSAAARQALHVAITSEYPDVARAARMTLAR
jgi:HEAT repeat protein